MIDDLELELEPEALGPVQMMLPAPVRLMDALPANFPIGTLLSFLPDPKLKRDLEAQAARALALDVTGAAGVQRADRALADLRLAVAAVEQTFDEVVKIANALHKRLTGLRADFTAQATAVIKTLNARVYAEQTALRQAAELVRIRAQQEADRLARAAAAAVAKEAERAKAPAALVEALKAQAQTMTAPPVVSPTLAPVLAHTAIVERWKVRPAGCQVHLDPNPSVSDMTGEQRERIYELLAAVLSREVPLECIEVNWPYLNRRAAAEKSTLAIPGLEAFDAGGTRAKPRR